jgi:hypothetical protein
MRAEGFFSDAVPVESKAIIDEVVSAPEGDFVSDAATLRLNPRTDFRYADLQGVDFSGCDLRNFDFTGADLRGSIGIAVIWDDSTILDKADLSDSLFAHRTDLRRFFAENPYWDRELRRVRKGHWAGLSLWLADSLRGRHRREASYVARAIFDSSHDPVLRTNILYFMRPSFVAADEHRNFLFELFACHAKEKITMRSALEAVSGLFYNDVAAFKILEKFASNSDEDLRLIAIRGILKSRMYDNIARSLAELLTREPSERIRRFYVGAVARRHGLEFEPFVSEHASGVYLDFATPLTDAKIRDIARIILRREKAVRQADNLKQAGAASFIDVKPEAMEAFSAVVSARLRVLAARGVPFTFADR